MARDTFGILRMNRERMAAMTPKQRERWVRDQHRPAPVAWASTPVAPIRETVTQTRAQWETEDRRKNPHHYDEDGRYCGPDVSRDGPARDEFLAETRAAKEREAHRGRVRWDEWDRGDRYDPPHREGRDEVYHRGGGYRSWCSSCQAEGDQTGGYPCPEHR